MITSFAALGPQSSVGAGADLLLRTTQREFPVLDGAKRLRGVATRKAIVDALKRHGDEHPIMEIMTRNVPQVSEDACLEAVFLRIQQEGTPFIGIADANGACVGYLTADSISKMAMIGAARASRVGPARGVLQAG